MAAMYESFVTKARALGTEVYRVDDPAAAKQLIEKLIREAGAKKVALVPAPLLDALDMEKVVSAARAELLTAGSVRKRADEADLGITTFDLAIAETGTLVQDATALDRRLVSMLPPVHLAVMPLDGLTATFRQAIANLAAGEIPGYLAFVSGPSRTADIERVLTIGVHGPGRLIVVFIDEQEGRGSR
ncbi:lactate utilization protein B/C [Desulfotomaculum copahuensis]|uniref:Lactate utilization protein B/C n=2 Tax=Desulfotomaculum copahuensis TaxID=1838280 RepID=A0A1B7LEG4_9FIRM|nr:lactate utilization protein B/C [Desulfotomaculum copahuensis]